MHSHNTMNRGQCSTGKFLPHQQLRTITLRTGTMWDVQWYCSQQHKTHKHRS